MVKLFQGLVAAVGTLLGGAYLLSLYGFTIWASVGALNAIQLREELEGDATTADRSLITYVEVDRAWQQFVTKVDSIAATKIPFDEETGLNQSQILAEQREIVVRLANTFGENDTLAASGDLWWAYMETDESFGRKVACESPANTAAPDGFCGDIASYWYLEDKYFQLVRASQADELERELQHQAQQEAIVTDTPLYKYFSQIEFFDQFGLKWLLMIPEQSLILVLTMAMGMLGAVVTMTWLYIRQDASLSLRRFFVLPFIGSMSAIIVLVFISAGKLTLTAGASQDALNPFVLSFVGIISGLLSERAYTRISTVGSNFFNVDDDNPRWATARLREAMDASDLSVAELARHLGTTEEEAGRIANESTTATLTQQRLIAATVRRAVRDIFTDLPPDAPGSTSDAPAQRPRGDVGETAAPEDGQEPR
jgi:hypothetical protein